MPSHKAWLRLGVPSAPSGLPVLWATQNPPRAAVLTGRVSYRERSQIETSHRKTRVHGQSPGEAQATPSYPAQVVRAWPCPGSQV